MPKDSTNAAIAVGATVKFVGTVLAVSEPNQNNFLNVVVQPNNTQLKDNNNNNTKIDGKCYTFSGTQLTVGS